MITQNEIDAIAIADKYVGNISNESKLKWLAGEVLELSNAITKDDHVNAIEEIGDCAYLLLHLLSRVAPKNMGILDCIEQARDKMITKNTSGISK